MRDEPRVRGIGALPAGQAPGLSRAAALICGSVVMVAAVTTSLLLRPSLVSALLCVGIALGGVVIGMYLRPARTVPAAGGGDRDEPGAEDFLRLWAALELAMRAQVAKRLGDTAAERPVPYVLSDYRAARGLTDAEMAELRELLTIRQAMTHGVHGLAHEHLEPSYRLLQQHLDRAEVVIAPSTGTTGAPAN